MDTTNHSPNSSWQTIGQLLVHSGRLRLVDPVYLLDDDDAALGCEVLTPNGQFDVQIAVVNDPIHGTYVTQLRVLINAECVPVTSKNRCDVNVDSAMVVMLDSANIEPYWIRVGPHRQAVLVGADKPQILALLRQKGFRFGDVTQWATPFLDPLNLADEDRMRTLIRTHGLAGTPIVRTGNSYDQIVDTMQATDQVFACLDFPNGQTGFAVATRTGRGDGCYEVHELHGESGLYAIEIDFRPEHNTNIGL